MAYIFPRIYIAQKANRYGCVPRFFPQRWTGRPTIKEGRRQGYLIQFIFRLAIVLCASYSGCVKIRFYLDAGTRLPHIYRHDVSMDEVADVLMNSGEDRPGRDGSRVAMGQTHDGRYLRVIYVRDPKPDSVFVITAYDLRGRPLLAYRRRMSRKK